MPLNLRREPRRSAVLLAPMLALFTGVLVMPACLAEQEGLSELFRSTTSHSARQSALRALPLDWLSVHDRRRVHDVVSQATIYRRLPTHVVDCDPELFQLLIQYPEIIVDIWNVMGVANITLDRTGGNTFRASDGQGTLAQMETLYQSHNRHLIYAEGTYHGPIFRRPVTAKCVMLLRSAHVQEKDGRHRVTTTLDTFIQMERVGAEIMAKTFQPLVGKVADYNFTETMAFVSKLSHAAETKPHGIERLTHKLAKVQPDVRHQLVEISERMAAEARRASPAALSQQAFTKLARRRQAISTPAADK